MIPLRILTLFLYLVLACLVFPAVGFAQDEGLVSTSVWTTIVGILIPLLAVAGGSSVISAFVSSDRPWMKLVDALAFNWLRARNDPLEQ